jgi:hypothetical protein
MSRINRVVAGGSAIMVAGFATLAAQVSAPGGASTATAASTAPATSTPTAASPPTTPAQTAAPAPTQQAPIVTSGGS